MLFRSNLLPAAHAARSHSAWACESDSDGSEGADYVARAYAARAPSRSKFGAGANRHADHGNSPVNPAFIITCSILTSFMSHIVVRLADTEGLLSVAASIAGTLGFVGWCMGVGNLRNAMVRKLGEVAASLTSGVDNARDHTRAGADSGPPCAVTLRRIVATSEDHGETAQPVAEEYHLRAKSSGSARTPARTSGSTPRQDRESSGSECRIFATTTGRDDDEEQFAFAVTESTETEDEKTSDEEACPVDGEPQWTRYDGIVCPNEKRDLDYDQARCCMCASLGLWDECKDCETKCHAQDEACLKRRGDRQYFAREPKVWARDCLRYSSMQREDDPVPVEMRAMGTHYYHPTARVGGDYHVFDIATHRWHKLAARARPIDATTCKAGITAPKVERQLLLIRIAALEEENLLMQRENRALRERVGALECRLQLMHGDQPPAYPAPCSRRQSLEVTSDDRIQGLDKDTGAGPCPAVAGVNEVPALTPPNTPPEPEPELGRSVRRYFDGKWYEGTVVGVSWDEELVNRRFTVMYADLDVEDIEWEEYVRGRREYVLKQEQHRGKRARDGTPQARKELTSLGVDMTLEADGDAQLPEDRKRRGADAHNKWLWGTSHEDDCHKRWQQDTLMHANSGCDRIRPMYGMGHPKACYNQLPLNRYQECERR